MVRMQPEKLDCNTEVSFARRRCQIQFENYNICYLVYGKIGKDRISFLSNVMRRRVTVEQIKCTMLDLTTKYANSLLNVGFFDASFCLDLAN